MEAYPGPTLPGDPQGGLRVYRQVLPVVAALTLLAAAAPASAAEVGASGKCHSESGDGGGFELAVRSEADPNDALTPSDVDGILDFLDGVAGFAGTYVTYAATMDAALQDGEASTDACDHPDDRDDYSSSTDPSDEEHPDYVEAHVAGGGAYVQVCVHNGEDPDRPDAGDVTVSTDSSTGCPTSPQHPSTGIRLP